MIEPDAPTLEAQVRNFIQRIPRRRLDANDAGASGKSGFPYVEDGPRITRLDSGDLLQGRRGGSPSPSPSPVATTPSSHFSFQIVDASEAESPLLLIYDGLINDELPEGMGGDDYQVGAYDGINIYLGVTYDTDTFEITSRYLNIGDTPEAVLGSFYITLGGAAVTYDANGKPTVLPYNAHCGDITMVPMFALSQGKTVVSWVPRFSDFVALT